MCVSLCSTLPPSPPPPPLSPPQERLIQLVAGVLLDRNDDARLEAAGADAGACANAAANVGAAVAALPKLATGIDVNVRFSGPAAFEFTDEVAIFDLLGLPLLHGWVVSGEDEAACVVAGLTYNQAAELAVQAEDDESATGVVAEAASPPAAAAPSPPAAAGLGSLSPSDLASTVERNLRLSETQASPSAPATDVVRALVATALARVVAAAAPTSSPPPLTLHQRANLARSFLHRTANQLTPCGLVALHERVPPGGVAVLFRNNHFATLARPPPSTPAGGLYALVTDVGYARVGDVVWERLDDVDGDTALVGGDFASPPDRRAADDDSAAAAAAAAAAAEEAGTTASLDADHALAVRLQEEEDARAVEVARRRRAAAEAAAAEGAPPNQPSGAPGQSVRPARRRTSDSGDGGSTSRRRPLSARLSAAAESDKCCVQ